MLTYLHNYDWTLNKMQDTGRNCLNTSPHVLCVFLLPIQTSPKQPWPSLSSSRKDSRGISQASLASPWVWGLTVGHTVVSLWQSPSACSVIQWDQKPQHYTRQGMTHTHTHTHTHTPIRVFEAAGCRRLKACLFHASIHSIWCGWIYTLMLTAMKYKWDEVAFITRQSPLQSRAEMGVGSQDFNFGATSRPQTREGALKS